MVASLRSEMRSYHQAEFVTHEQIGDNSLVPPFSTHTHTSYPLSLIGYIWLIPRF